MNKALSVIALSGLVIFGLVPQTAQASGNSYQYEFLPGQSTYVRITQPDAPACFTGLGTASSPWLIGSKEDLKVVGLCGRALQVDSHYETQVDQPQFYELTADINLDCGEAGGCWTPLNAKADGQWVQDGGVLRRNILDFNGAGHTISNFFPISQSKVGLFSSTENTVIRNLNIVTKPDEEVSGFVYTGVVVGFAKSTTFDRVRVILKGNIRGDEATGGIAGEARENSGIRASSVQAAEGFSPLIYARTNVGGLVGNLDESTIQTSAVKNVEIHSDEFNGQSRAGGIIGRYITNSDQVLRQVFFQGLIKNCVTSYACDSNAEEVGGLVGLVSQWSANPSSIVPRKFTIQNSAVRGLIRSSKPGVYVGRFEYVSNFDFTNNYATVEVQDSEGVTRSSSELVYDLGDTNTTASVVRDNFYEPRSGSEISNAFPISRVDSFTSFASLPSTWKAIQSTSTEIVDKDAFDWVVRSGFNEGRPMPSELYNLGFFTPASALSGDRGSTAGADPNSVEAPSVVVKPVLVRSSLVRIGRQLRVNCSSPNAMRLVINGRTAVWANAGSLQKNYWLKLGTNSVSFITGGKVIRRITYHVN